MRGWFVGALVVSTAMTAIADATPGSTEISRQTLACGPNVVLGCQDDTEQEVHVAVNPVDADNAVAVTQQGRYYGGAAQGISYVTTLDGGLTWTGATLPGLTTGELPRTSGVGPPWDRASDPVVAFDRRHAVVLAQSLVLNGIPTIGGSSGGHRGVAINRSFDDGLTFDDPVIIDAAQNGGHDKNWITVDNSPVSPFYGRAYAVWNSGFATSDDGGVTWMRDTELGGGLLVVTGPTGRVTVLNGASALISDDGGATWRLGGDMPFGGNGTESLTSLVRDFAIPAAAVDAATGRIVFAYQGASSGALAPSRIFVTISEDGGERWSGPRAVTPAEPPSFAYLIPAVAVEGDTIYVTYRRRSLGPAALVDIAMQVSQDSGETYGEPVLLAEPSVTAFSPLTVGVYTQPNFFLGEYMGLAVQDGHWYAAWPQAGPFVDGTTSRTHQRTYAATGIS
jgi:hypothetical protein